MVIKNIHKNLEF